jgi:hypothetical protein
MSFFKMAPIRLLISPGFLSGAGFQGEEFASIMVLFTAGASKKPQKMLSGKFCSKERQSEVCSSVVLITAGAPENLRKCSP